MGSAVAVTYQTPGTMRDTQYTTRSAFNIMLVASCSIYIYGKCIFSIYQALFEAMRGEEDWFLGVFWWNWNTDDSASYDGNDDCLTPQWKPAEDVLRRYFRAVKNKPTPPQVEPLCVGAGKCTC